MICKHILLITFLNEPKDYAKLNGSSNCYVSRTINLTICHLFTHS